LQVVQFALSTSAGAEKLVAESCKSRGQKSAGLGKRKGVTWGKERESTAKQGGPCAVKGRRGVNGWGGGTSSVLKRRGIGRGQGRNRKN